MSKINIIASTLILFVLFAYSELTLGQSTNSAANSWVLIMDANTNKKIIGTAISTNEIKKLWSPHYPIGKTISKTPAPATENHVDKFNIPNEPLLAPTITVTEVMIPQMSSFIGSTSSEIVNLSGVNLFGNINISIASDVSNQFDEPSKPTLSKLADNTAVGTVTLTYRPTVTGTHTANLKIESSYATTVIRTLTGIGIDPNNPYNLDTTLVLTSLNETFEAENEGTTLPERWKNLSIRGTKTWEIKLLNANKFAQISALGSTETQQIMLISPAINFDAIVKNNVTFDWLCGNATPGATIKAYVMKLNGTKTEVKSINATTPIIGFGSTYKKETLDLSAHSGVAFLVLEYNGSSTLTTTYRIDNIVALEKPTINIEKTNVNFNIYTVNGNVEFFSISGERVSIYNAVGKKLVDKLTVNGLNTIPVTASGLVLVKVGNRVAKIIL